MYSDVVFATDVDHLIVKHNSLIESKTDLSEVENKVVALAIVLTRLYENTERDMSIDATIRIYASDYSKAYGVLPQTAYNAINEAMNALFDRQFVMTSDKGVPTTYHWLESKANSDNAKLVDGFVELAFSKKAIELITGLGKGGNYTSYGLERISRLKGSYSGRLYEMIIQYKNTDKVGLNNKKTTRIFSIDDYRELVGVAPHEHREKKDPTVTRLDNLKKYAIEKPLEVINLESDITAEAHYHKTGKRVTGVSFTFEMKKGYVSAFAKEATVSPAKSCNDAENTSGMRTVGDETKNKPHQKPAVEIDAPYRSLKYATKLHRMTDSQILTFASKLCSYGPFASMVGKQGELAPAFLDRITSELVDPENRVKWAKYLYEVGFCNDSIKKTPR